MHLNKGEIAHDIFRLLLDEVDKRFYILGLGAEVECSEITAGDLE